MMDTIANAKPPVETKRQKFERVTTARLKRLHEGFDQLANIGRNQSNYEYTDKDIERIEGYLTEEVARVMLLMQLRKRQTNFAFRFDGSTDAQ